MRDPETLQEAVEYFAHYENCHDFLVAVRWPDSVTCPHCGSRRVRYMTSVRRWQCYEKHPRPQFSLKTGSVFEDSPIALKKWLAAMWLIVNAKNGISSYEIHRALGVTQKSAWFMAHRIRTALHTGSFERMLGDGGAEVEVDETFIGGKAHNMHADVKARRITGRGPPTRRWCSACWNAAASSARRSCATAGRTRSTIRSRRRSPPGQHCTATTLPALTGCTEAAP